MAEALLDRTTILKADDFSFRAVVQEGGLTDLPSYLEEEGLTQSRMFVLTDSTVDELHGETIANALKDAEIEHAVLAMPPGEENKTLQTAGEFVDAISSLKAIRNDTVIAFGGGVVGDLGGFVASIYNRGINLVQVPTTLLAMVDASIGGKTGVDHGGKNKTGTFYQPRLIVADPTVLSTLEPRVYTEGFGEVVKYAMLDAAFFPELEHKAENLREFSPAFSGMLSRIIARSAKQKIDVIADDPHEQKPNGRILLNYGHTLGHGLEAAGRYTELLHGEAVAVGMTFAAQLAVDLELAEPELCDRQERVLQAIGLPTRYEGKATVDNIMTEIARDKKNTGSDSTRFVLPRSVGEMVVMHVDNPVVERAVNSFLQS